MADEQVKVVDALAGEGIDCSASDIARKKYEKPVLSVCLTSRTNAQSTPAPDGNSNFES